MVLNGQSAVTKFTAERRRPNFEDTGDNTIGRHPFGQRGPVRPATPTTFDLVVRTLQLEAWAGRWVAVDSVGTVRCDSASLAELLAEINRNHITDVEVMRAPDPREPIVYGLG